MLVLAMVMSFAAPAIAGPFDPLRETGSLTITKYLTNRVPVKGISNEGRLLTEAPANIIKALAGVEFQVVRVVPQPGQAGGAGAIKSNDDGQWYIPLVGEGAYSQTITTDQDGEALFANMPLGIYYVTELMSNLVTDPSAPFFVSIPTILEGENGEDDYLYDVHAYPKNEDLGIKKELTSANKSNGIGVASNGTGVGFGDEVTYTLTVDVPTDIANAQVFKVTDIYSAGLKFKEVVSVEATPTAAGPIPYTMTPSAPTSDGGTIVFDFKDGETNKFDALIGAHQVKIKVTFTVTDQASMLDAIPNQAKLDYTNRYGHDHERESDIPEVYTGGLRIFKHDSVITTLGLQGASFVLVPKLSANYEADRGAAAGTFTVGEGADAKTVNAYANFYKRLGATTPLVGTSDASGIVTFQGIPYGKVVDGEYVNTPTEYWLVEVAAPNGYRTPGGQPTVVTVSATSWVASPVALDLDIKVGNVKGFNFPLTGGTGTMMFFVAALALAGMALGFNRLGKKETHTA